LADNAERVFAAMLTVEGEWGICDKHLHCGVRTACLYCVYMQANAALSDIDFAIQPKNVRDHDTYHCSWFDIECAPEEVAKRVTARIEALETRIAELESK